jgi:dTDP-4-dehydrorhamnose 3,5-epimerase
VQYKVTDYYQPGDEYGIWWNDADLGVDWPQGEAILSDKDRDFPQLKDVPESLLPKITT